MLLIRVLNSNLKLDGNWEGRVASQWVEERAEGREIVVIFIYSSFATRLYDTCGDGACAATFDVQPLRPLESVECRV